MSQDPQQDYSQGRPLWTIGAVRDTPVLNQGGSFVDGKDVEVLFWDGSTEHLQLPKSQYNDGTVSQLAQRAAETHLKVKALSGPLIPGDVIAG